MTQFIGSAQLSCIIQDNVFEERVIVFIKMQHTTCTTLCTVTSIRIIDALLETFNLSIHSSMSHRLILNLLVLTRPFLAIFTSWLVVYKCLNNIKLGCFLSSMRIETLSEL